MSLTTIDKVNLVKGKTKVPKNKITIADALEYRVRRRPPIELTYPFHVLMAELKFFKKITKGCPIAKRERRILKTRCTSYKYAKKRIRLLINKK